MAVSEQTPYIEYTANGTTNSFSLEFDCDNQDNLIVLVDDVEPIIGTWSLSGGAVVFGTAPISGQKITLQRNTPFRRDGDFQSYDNSFRPGPVNKGFDWVWLKLQELGVADWILSNRIDALKNYVDSKDDELKNYLQNLILAQGVALDQLDEYYNYLMQRLAQIAVDKGWDASFVVDGDKTQKQINALILDPDSRVPTDKMIKTWSGRTQESKNKDDISLYDFGYIADGTLHTLQEWVDSGKFTGLIGIQVAYPSASSLSDSIDTIAVQTAIDYCKSKGKTVKIKAPSGKSIHNKEITWKSYAFFEGVSYHDTKFQKAVGFNGRLIVSENFDSITGTSASLTGLPITNFGIVKIQLDGNYIQSDAYVNNYGKGNLFIYGTKYTLDVKSVNTDGVGVWLEYDGNEDFVNDVIRDADINLIIFDTAYEGLIFKGAPDILISKVIQKGAGKITSTDPRNYTLWSSPNYPALGRLDGIVFEKGAEIGVIHSFGNSVGYGIRLEDGRINAELLISESVLGGIDIYTPVYGIIDKLQVHNVKGGVTYIDPLHASAGTFANIDIKSTAGLVINTIRSDHSGTGMTGQNHLHLKSFNCCIGMLRVNGFGKPGHAIYCDAGASSNTIGQYVVNNIIGNSGFDSAASAALVRNSNNAARQNFFLGGSVVNCPVGLRAIGTSPRVEKIELFGSGLTSVFEGVNKGNPGQKWNLALADVGNVVKLTEFSSSTAFNPTITTLQEFTFTHYLIQEPNIKDITITVSDLAASGAVTTAEIQYMYISSISPTEIKVCIKMKVANATNTLPQICITAKI